jgi:hypothetical protein
MKLKVYRLYIVNGYTCYPFCDFRLYMFQLIVTIGGDVIASEMEYGNIGFSDKH